jgi:hypothetical protein
VNRRAVLIMTRRNIVNAFCFKPVYSFVRYSILFEIEHLLSRECFKLYRYRESRQPVWEGGDWRHPEI